MREESFGQLFQPKSLGQLGEGHGKEVETIYERHTPRFQTQYLVTGHHEVRFDTHAVCEGQHEVSVVAAGVVSYAHAAIETAGEQVVSKQFHCIRSLKDLSFPTAVARDTLLHRQIHAASAHSMYDA